MRIISLSENLRAVVDTVGVLNDPPPLGYTYRLPVAGFGLSSLTSPDPVKRAAFRGFLRELIGEWFRCGKRVMPKGAMVSASGMGLSEGRYLWKLVLSPMVWDEYGRRVERRELDPADPAFHSWLWMVYWDYLHRATPNIWFNSDGEVLMNYTSSAWSQPEPPVALPPFLNAESPNQDCWMEAVLWFILLLNSGYVQRLDRCAYCRRYFVREREMKSGQSYKRGGPSCGDCRGEVSKARTSDTRSDAKARMLETAAEAWTDWKKSNRTPDRYAAVASRVNAKCKREIYITTRKDRIEALWVKRNETKILERVNRIALGNGESQNAKG